jgi:hypothetical protein
MLPKRPNRLLSTVRHENGTPLYEVGLNRRDEPGWPIVLNYLAINAHSFLTPDLARELAVALNHAADAHEHEVADHIRRAANDDAGAAARRS